MRHLSKAYRLAAALLVLSLSLGVVLPLMQHVCAMERHAATEHAPSGPAVPCMHRAATPAAPAAAAREAAITAQAPAPTAPCCLVGPTSPRTEAPALLPAAAQSIVALLPALATLLAEPNDAGQAKHPLPSSPPSPAPVPLHVLHAAFLN